MAQIQKQYISDAYEMVVYEVEIYEIPTKAKNPKNSNSKKVDLKGSAKVREEGMAYKGKGNMVTKLPIQIPRPLPPFLSSVKKVKDVKFNKFLSMLKQLSNLRKCQDTQSS